MKKNQINDGMESSWKLRGICMGVSPGNVFLTAVIVLWMQTLVSVAGSEGSGGVVVHEWGTFTVLQDHEGRPVKGVNINEESLPEFVYELSPELAPDSSELGQLFHFGEQLARRAKGIQRNYHAALMRMETPVIYLYPTGNDLPEPIDIQVAFNGGWITEWYPDARVRSPGFSHRYPLTSDALNPGITGHITWDGVRFDDSAQVPVTDSPVWLAPRETDASILTTKNGESEKYLFYRGVANLQAPLRIRVESNQLEIHENVSAEFRIDQMDGLKLWLVEVGEDGRLKSRSIPLLSGGEENRSSIVAETAFNFANDESVDDGFQELRGQMLEALMAYGLYEREAEAMLETWKTSYFQAPGLRVFFTLPQEWTDRVLPLALSGADIDEVARAMIGRIELISDRHIKLIKEIASYSKPSSSEWFANWIAGDRDKALRMLKALEAGALKLEDLGMAMPRDFAAYTKLGRFRDALISHFSRHAMEGIEQKRLIDFARAYRIPRHL